jgi:G3E family GTPase
MNSSEKKPTADEAADMLAAALDARQSLMGLMFAARKMPQDLRAADRSLPLTIIGGFLGAGKTTVLNQLLVKPHGRRLVVLVNDFGSINIDAALVSSRTEDVIGLTNGCACCNVSGDLTRALIDIAQQEEAPDAIVLEASGLAEPGGIAQIALMNPAIRVDGMVSLVDAVTLKERATDPQTRALFRNQLAAADLLVLSKIDLLDETEKKQARDWLAAEFPDKPVIGAVNGDVPEQAVLGIASTRDLRAESQASYDHEHQFDSLSFTVDEALDRERLHELFESLPKSLLRAKGVLNLAEEPERPTIYQRVGARWSYTTAEPWGKKPPHSSIVLIGPAKSLDQGAIQACLEACRAVRRPVSG